MGFLNTIKRVFEHDKKRLPINGQNNISSETNEQRGITEEYEASWQDKISRRDQRLRELAGTLVETNISENLSVLLAELLNLTSGISGGFSNTTTAHKVIKTISSAERSQFFNAILKAKKKYGWQVLHNEKYSRNRNFENLKNPDDESFANFCENILNALYNIGFKANKPQAEYILDHFQANNMLRYGAERYRVLRDIGKLADVGTDFDQTTQDKAKDLFDISMSYLKGKRMDPMTAALERVFNSQGQSTLMSRLSETPDAQAFDWLSEHHEGTDRAIELLRAVRTETETLWEQIRTHYKASNPQTSWLNDPSSFESYFGKPHIDQNPALEFGWWFEDQKGLGFGQYNIPKHFCRADEQLPNYNIMMASELEEKIRIYKHESNHSPRVFSRPAIPKLNIFTFGGVDSEGLFLEHLTSCSSSKPTKTWLIQTRKYIEEYGKDCVRKAFLEWTHPLTLCEEEISLGIKQAAPGNCIANFIGRSLSKNLGTCLVPPNTSSNLWCDPVLVPDGKFNSVSHHRQVALQLFATWQAPQLAEQTDSHRFERHIQDAHRLVQRPLSDNNVDVMCGVVWAMSLIPDAKTVEQLKILAEEFYTKRHGDFRSKKCGNAVLWALGHIGTLEATHALAYLNRRVKDKSVAKLVDTALTSAGQKIGLSLEDMQEMSVHDFGVGVDGERREVIGDHTVVLKIASSRKTELFTLDATGERKRGVIKLVKSIANEAQLEVLEELKQAQKAIPPILKDAKRRLISSWVQEREWNVLDWVNRFEENRLIASIARRLVWTYTDQDDTKDISWTGNDWRDPSGSTVDLFNNQATLKLWHPLTSTTNSVGNWQDHLERTEIRQPFAQVWRTQFCLTEAELETRTYTNRFAGHILQQAPFIAMLRHQGWTSGSKAINDTASDERRNLLHLPSAGLVASFWTTGVGTDHIHEAHHEYFSTRNFEFISTDRLCFYKADKKGRPTKELLSLVDVPHMIFSEVLNTLDLIIGRTSIGTDKLWQDMGSDADHPLSENALLTNYRQSFSNSGQKERVDMRHKMLSRIIPKLDIANQCLLESDTLYVDGKFGTYGIHLGSISVKMQPGNRHICIVPKRNEDRTILPFAGDEGLSLILGKAVALAADNKITDSVIVGQIKQN